MAYKATLYSFVASLFTFYILLYFLGLIFGAEISNAAGFGMVILVILAGVIVYGRMLVHPQHGPIGFKNLLFLSFLTIFSTTTIFLISGFSGLFFGKVIPKMAGSTNQSDTSSQKSYSAKPDESQSYQSQTYQNKSSTNQPGLAPAAQNWIDRNPWFNQPGFEDLTKKAIDTSLELENLGYHRNDRDLYNELDRILFSRKDNSQAGNGLVTADPATGFIIAPGFVQLPRSSTAFDNKAPSGDMNPDESKQKARKKESSQSDVRYNHKTGTYTID